MTNGEMIQKVFDCEVCEPLPEDDIIHVIFPDKNDSAIGFDWSWWKMEYIDPTAKNNLGVDCISRQAVLEQAYAYGNGLEPDGYCVNVEDIQALPPVTPIRPKGHWIDKQHSFETCSAECSACHERSNGYVFDNGFSLECEYYDYCPKCGSDNREVEE